jgi:hypothetical protein
VRVTSSIARLALSRSVLPCYAIPPGAFSQTLGTQQTESTMPYIVVLAITLILIAGSVVFVRTPPRRDKPPSAK